MNLEMTKKIEIDGMNFQITKFGAFQSMQIEKRIMGILAPIGASFIPKQDGKKRPAVNFEDVGKTFSQVLYSLSDSEFQNTILTALKNTIYLGNGEAPQEITLKVFDSIFIDKLSVVYKLIFEIMKFNNFCIFELLRSDEGLSKIFNL